MLNPSSQHPFSHCIGRALRLSWTCQRQLHSVKMQGRIVVILFRKSILLGNARIEIQNTFLGYPRRAYWTNSLPGSPSLYKNEAEPSSGSELCDMDYTVVETKRKFSDAGNPLLFMSVLLQHPSSALWESSDIIHLVIPV